MVAVHNRLAFLKGALESAVNQTKRVRVVLLDNGKADPRAIEEIRGPMGAAVEYHRNSKPLPQFRTMNRAIELCRTPWLSILHDDDELLPGFVEALTAAAPQVEDCRLFCGGTIFIDTAGRYFFRTGLQESERVRVLSGEDFAYRNWFSFPGHLMHVETARAVGGFPVNSIYTGDWDLWFRMAQAGGAAMLGANLSRYRCHTGIDRETNAAGRSGRTSACRAMQVKRNLGRLRKAGAPARFERSLFITHNCPTYRETLSYAPYMGDWLLSYCRRLLLLRKPASGLQAFQAAVLRAFGNPGARLAGHAVLVAERWGVRFRNPL